MRIAIEGQRLFRPKKHGMDFVALELVRNIQEIDKKNEYVVFVKPDADICLKSGGQVTVVPLDGGAYPVWEQYSLPHAAKKYGCDLLHCTSNTAPVYSNGVPLVVTLHDIFFLESHSILTKGYTTYQKFGNLYRRWVVPAVVKKARKIITVSYSEKNRIMHFFKLPENRVSVIYNGVSPFFKPGTDPIRLEESRNKYSLPERFLFFLGNTDPKKNTKGVLTAYAKFIRECDQKVPLVIADYPEASLLEILQEIHEPEATAHIHRLDYIRNTDLPGIYSMADLFLYPSFKESFGIPILEAMACGTPVITSNVFSMPEIAGNAAMLVDPNTPYDLTRAMNQLMAEPDKRKDMIRKGFEQVKRFSWKQMAEDYIRLYEEVLKTR